MATTTKLDDYLALLGFDPEATYDVPENPADAALSGVAAFVREHSAGQEPESTGIIHITGPSALGNSAPVKAVGNLLTSIQSTIDAVGASLMGNRSAEGSLPSAITSRTEMSSTQRALASSTRRRNLMPNPLRTKRSSSSQRLLAN